MQILNRRKRVNTKKQIEKSKLFLLGSLLVMLGLSILLSNYIKTLRLDVLNDKLILLSQLPVDNGESTIIADIPDVEYLEGDGYVPSPQQTQDFSRFLGVLEIPRIGLRRGFFDINSPLNTVERNVMKIPGSRMPNIERANLILAAHSGDAHISFFRHLHRLGLGDKAFITYRGVRYAFVIVDIYEVEKTGTVAITRNNNATVLTLITCTENSDTLQTVYILELVSKE